MLTAKKTNELTPRIVAGEPLLYKVYKEYGPPPFWHYDPGFTALLQIILGQQVSVASAAAAYRKLEEKTGAVTPQRVLSLTNEELRACYFSRQKAGYARHLAKAIMQGELVLETLPGLSDEEVKKELSRIKGIGNWTADIYLLLALHRPDVYPVGDLAANKVLRELELIPPKAGREMLLGYVEKFRPYRSVLTLLVWHKYIEDRGISFLK